MTSLFAPKETPSLFINEKIASARTKVFDIINLLTKQNIVYEKTQHNYLFFIVFILKYRSSIG